MNSKWCPNFRNCIGPQEACNVGSGRWPTPRVHENLVRLELSSCWRTWVAVADIGRLYCTSSCIGVCMYVYAFPDFPRTKANRLVGFQSKHTHTLHVAMDSLRASVMDIPSAPFAFPRTTPSKKFWPELLLNLYKLSSAGIDHGVVLP